MWHKYVLFFIKEMKIQIGTYHERAFAHAMLVIEINIFIMLKYYAIFFWGICLC